MSNENPPENPANEVETKSPEQIQAEIDATREELGDTVTAVAEKADVKKQAQDKVDDVKEQASAKASEVKEAATSKAEEIADKAKQATPESASAGVEQAQQIARQNPVPLAVGGAFLAGIVVGRLFSR
jgi:ElaB/YqjD/DUF883 family membrane-anchored ribosome-binding protein